MGAFIFLTAITWIFGFSILMQLGPASVCVALPVCAFFTLIWYIICLGDRRTGHYSSYLPADDDDDDKDNSDPFRLDEDGIPKDPITKWWLYNELLEQEKHHKDHDHNPFT